MNNDFDNNENDEYVGTFGGNRKKFNSKRGKADEFYAENVKSFSDDFNKDENDYFKRKNKRNSYVKEFDYNDKNDENFNENRDNNNIKNPYRVNFKRRFIDY